MIPHDTYRSQLPARLNQIFAFLRNYHAVMPNKKVVAALGESNWPSYARFVIKLREVSDEW